jgi:hypothetical protein
MKLLTWLKTSNRYKHIIGGFIIGLFGNSIYCSLYATTIAAFSLEYKDKASGNVWDWIDLICTIFGGILSTIIKLLLI